MAEQRAAGSNRRFSHQRSTTAPRERIWALWIGVEGWPAWDLGLKAAKLDGPAIRLGATGRLTPASGAPSSFEVTRFEPGEAYAFATQLPLARLIVERGFVDGPRTTFRHEVWFDGPLAGFWAALLGPQFRRQLPPSLDRLAALAEAGD